ncbi:unnamed protein product [Sphagnum jensenii]|uniref:RNB domain-containing protein n=1 Tax=Sphagnum jensenii TaxID=128206 RepID=A0ABP0V601_9BRYO
MIAAEFSLIEEHSEDSEREARDKKLEVPGKDLIGREDLRQMPFITIDGETARDFDDAIFVEKEKSGYILWVGIADLLRKVRQERGSIDFDLPEAELKVRPTGEVISILERPRIEAHRLIEEFMIAANEAVTEWALARDGHFCTAFMRSRPRMLLRSFRNSPQLWVFPLPPRVRLHQRSWRIS